LSKFSDQNIIVLSYMYVWTLGLQRGA